MAKSGFIYGNAPNANSTAEILKKYNKIGGKSYWNTAYSEINKAYNNGLYQLDNTMADNMASQNYAAMQAKNAAAQMNLGSGDLVHYNTYYDNALEQAYNSYKSSYNDAVGELNTSIGKAYDAVNTELAAQSQNTADFTNSAYDFLSSMASNIDSPLYENGNIGWQYDWLFKTTENPATGYRDLLDRDELNHLLYDENGTLNRRGQMFYDMMFNNEFIRKDDVKGEYGMRYTDYLAENNPELLEWATSVNQYDSSGMNNAQYIKKQLMGLEEDTFTNSHYFDLLTEDERKKFWNEGDLEQHKYIVDTFGVAYDETTGEFVNEKDYGVHNINPTTGMRYTGSDENINTFAKKYGAEVRREYTPFNIALVENLDDKALSNTLNSWLRTNDGEYLYKLTNTDSAEFRYVRLMINAIKNNEIPNGTIIDFADASAGTDTAYPATYMVMDNVLIPVQDSENAWDVKKYASQSKAFEKSLAKNKE